MKYSKLRCLHLGAGHICRHMHKFLRDKPWYEPVGLVDVSPESLAKTAPELGLPEDRRFPSLAAALDAVEADAVMVNTPSHLHHAQCLEVIARGLHILVAKPMTNTYEEALDLVRQAEAKGVSLAVGQQIRYQRHFLAVARHVASGALGKVEAAWFKNAKPRPKPANLAKLAHPTLVEMSCHHFDALLAVFPDSRPESIFCDGWRPSWSPYAGPCMVNALLRYQDGLHLSYHGGFSSKASMYDFRLEGRKGALECLGVHMGNDTMSYRAAAPEKKFEPAAIDEGIAVQDGWVAFFDAWFDHVNGVAEAPFGGRNNLKVMAMIAAAAESIETGAPVAIAGQARFTDAFPA